MHIFILRVVEVDTFCGALSKLPINESLQVTVLVIFCERLNSPIFAIIARVAKN